MSEDQGDFSANQLASLFTLLRDGSKAMFDKIFELDGKTLNLLFWGK